MLDPATAVCLVPFRPTSPSPAPRAAPLRSRATDPAGGDAPCPLGVRRRGPGWQWVSVCGKSLATLCGRVCGDDATAGLASPQPAATGARAQPYRRSSGLGAAARWPALAKAPAPGRAARPVLAGPCSPGPGCAARTGAADGHPSHGAARRSRRRGGCMKGCAGPGQGTSGVAEGRLYQKGAVCVLPKMRRTGLEVFGPDRGSRGWGLASLWVVPGHGFALPQVTPLKAAAARRARWTPLGAARHRLPQRTAGGSPRDYPATSPPPSPSHGHAIRIIHATELRFTRL